MANQSDQHSTPSDAGSPRHGSTSTTYYLIRGRKIGKRDGDFCLFEAGLGWIRDDRHEISDRLTGYDPSEPEDSPYAMFSSSIMDEIETITEEEAMDRVAEQIRLHQTRPK